MTTRAIEDALAGRSVLISETAVEPLQLVGRSGETSFLLGGSHKKGQRPSGPNPYEILASSLGACTAMTIRLYADREKLALTRVQVSVAIHRDEKTGRSSFDRRIFLDGYLDDAQRVALMEVANTCPVGRLLGGASDMRTFVEHSPEAWSEAPKEEEPIAPADAWWLDAQPNIDAD